MSLPCERCRSPLDDGDLRCAVCALPVPRHQQAQLVHRAHIARCEGCGAALRYDVEARAPRCAFCGAVTHLETSADPIEDAQGYLSFRVNAEAAREALARFLSTRGFFAPSMLAQKATLDALTPIYWTAWIFSCRALVSWTADSDQGSGRSRWAPHAGQGSLNLEQHLVSASRGLTEGEAGALAGHYDLRLAQPSAEAGAGAARLTFGQLVIERFSVQRSTARGIVARAVEAAAAQQAAHWIPGTRYRNLRVSALLEQLRTQRLAFPAYVMAYSYRGQRYRVVVHGQDPSCIVGAAPTSWIKVALTIIGALAVLIAVVLLFILLIAVASLMTR